MPTPTTLASRIGALAVLGTLGCGSAPPTERTASAAAPLAHGSSRWEYLADRYDRDGDGRITAEEYDRDPERFPRLDRDEDGVLTAADFERGRGSTAEYVAQYVLIRAFQFDGDPEELTREEIVDSVAYYDDDEDGRLDEEEFALLYEDRELAAPTGVMAAMLGDRDEFQLLRGVVDADEDGCVAAAELTAWYDEAFDPEFALVLLKGEEPDDDRGESGPAVGVEAPDFALPPVGGGSLVTLSSFAGDRPVALIFGSYT